MKASREQLVLSASNELNAKKQVNILRNAFILKGINIRVWTEKCLVVWTVSLFPHLALICIYILTLADFLFAPCWPQAQLLVNNLLTEFICLCWVTSVLTRVSIALNNVTCQKSSLRIHLRWGFPVSFLNSLFWLFSLLSHLSLLNNHPRNNMRWCWDGRWEEESCGAFTHRGYPVHFFYGTRWAGWFPWVRLTLGSCVFVEVWFWTCVFWGERMQGFGRIHQHFLNCRCKETDAKDCEIVYD